MQQCALVKRFTIPSEKNLTRKGFESNIAQKADENNSNKPQVNNYFKRQNYRCYNYSKGNHSICETICPAGRNAVRSKLCYKKFCLCQCNVSVADRENAHAVKIS